KAFLSTVHKASAALPWPWMRAAARSELTSPPGLRQCPGRLRMQLKNRLDHFAMAPHRSANGRTTISSTHTRQRDRAPDALAAGTPQRLRDDLVALLGADRVLTRSILSASPPMPVRIDFSPKRS